MRRNDLDYSRGLAILMILVGHSNGMNDFCVKLIYSFHVPLFFVITGMLVRYTDSASNCWRRILKNRFLYTVLPCIVWEIILSVFYFFVKGISAKELVVNSLTLNFNLSVLWFIPCMLVAEATWLGILKASRKIAKKQDPMAVSLSAIAVFGMAGAIVNVLFLKRVLIATAFLAFGYTFERLRENGRIKKIICHPCTCVLTAIMWFASAAINIKPDLAGGILGNPFLYYASSAFGSISIILAFGYVKWKISPLLWVGKNSLAFFFTHPFVRHGIIAIGEKIFCISVEGLLLAALMILADAVFVWCIEKTVPEMIGQKRKKRVVKE